SREELVVTLGGQTTTEEDTQDPEPLSTEDEVNEGDNVVEISEIPIEELPQNPESQTAEEWFEIGQNFLENNEITEAINAFENAITLQPDFEEAWYNIGLAYERIGMADKALGAYDMAMEIDPGNSEYEMRQSDMLETLSDQEESLVAEYTVEVDNATISIGELIEASLIEASNTETVDEVQENLFTTVFESTILEFDDSVNMEELLKSSQEEVNLTDDEFVLAEAVFSSAFVSEEAIKEFETPPTLEAGGEELPIAPIALAADELPSLMRQLASVEVESYAGAQSTAQTSASIVSPSAVTVSAASVASTIVQSSSIIMQGFSSMSSFSSTQFVSSFFSTSTSTSVSSTTYSYYFTDPYRTYFQTVPLGPSVSMNLIAVPENPRPGEYLTLAGSLRDQFGRPIPRAQVRILRTDERGFTAVIGTARTDFSGNYLFRTIAIPGVYWYASEYRQMPRLTTVGYSNSVRIMCAAYQNWGVTLTAMPTGGYIGDRLLLYGFVTVDGFPVGGGAPVELQYQYGGKWYRMIQRQTDAQGIFAYPLQGTAPGTITVRAVFRDPYGMQKESNPVVLNIMPIPILIPHPGGPTDAVLTLYTQSPRLPSFGSTVVYGWLSTRSGAPLGGMPIAIEAQMQQGGPAMRSVEYRTTRIDGSFDVFVAASQGSGAITVQAAFPGSGPYPPVSSMPVTITFGGGNQPVPAPTKVPTKTPTKAPTPTKTPTKAPTKPPITAAPTGQQVQITTQYSPANPRAGQDVTVTGILTTLTGQPVSGVSVEGFATVQSGICQSTAQNVVTTNQGGNFRYVFQPSCDGKAQVTIKFAGTPQYLPISTSFTVLVDKYQAKPTSTPTKGSTMKPIPMVSIP
ncbi:MAG: tetratricopeptide repeat protein, partial [Methanomicrobiales archaeon]|nr:tetratricopeptide repeat protein [Methanomicrobiales archaeon]